MMEVDTEIYGDVEATGETPKALFCLIDGDEVCIPRSQIDADSEVQGKGDYGDLIITSWIAHKKGLPQTTCEHGYITWHRFEDYTWCEGPFRYDGLPF